LRGQQREASKNQSREAQTKSRPLRGAENVEKAGSSACADLELEAEIARLSPICRKDLQSCEAKKAATLFFSGLGERGGEIPLFFLRLKNLINQNARFSESVKQILKSNNVNLCATQTLESSTFSTQTPKAFYEAA